MEKLDIEPTLESLYTYKVNDDKPQEVITTDHESHCDHCFNTRKCQEINSFRSNTPKIIQCKIVMCQYSCGREFHECKLNEHQFLCSNVPVHCINADNGCPLMMERRLIANHLGTCPASVVVCNKEWFRKSIFGGDNPTIENDSSDWGANRSSASDGGWMEPDGVALNSMMMAWFGFKFMCGREFRRDEYAGHFHDVHDTMLPHLNRLLFTRCPMRGQECSFVADRIFPFDDNHKIVFIDELGVFCTIQIQSDITETKPPIETDNIQPRNICDLPIELLLLLTRYLDPLSLSCLSMTCRLMREVCVSVVVKRGIVVLQWKRKPHKTGWEVIAYNWKFSTSFSPIRKWCFVDVGRLYNHIQSCPYNDRQIPEAPFSYNVSLENVATFETFWENNQEKSHLRSKYGIIKNHSPK